MIAEKSNYAIVVSGSEAEISLVRAGWTFTKYANAEETLSEFVW